MRTVRRLYLYAVSAISLEVLLWGMIGLGRSIVCQMYLRCNPTSIISQGLAAIIVGIPFFAVHWWLAQRSAQRDNEERASGIRALFLYGMVLGTLIPIVQNGLSLLDRLALRIVGMPASFAFLGSNQTNGDNLIAMVMNAIF